MIREIEPLCVLDFYVHEDYQRGGFGKALFMAMLQNEQTSPERLAYDRPSPKLLSFLRRHFELSSFFPQPNRYVVFDSNAALMSCVQSMLPCVKRPACKNWACADLTCLQWKHMHTDGILPTCTKFLEPS